jgi:ring-1,2-phenylacetyl-CoA epoxidase subunit PaaA
VDTARYEGVHPWAARVARDADIGASRQGGDMRLSVFHYPLQGWLDAVVMNVLQGLAATVQISEMAQVSYQPLAEVFRKIAPIEARHAELGLEGLSHIAATEEGHEEIEESLAYWRPRVAAGFGASNSARFERLAKLGLRHRTNEALLAEWMATVDAHLADMTLI